MHTLKGFVHIQPLVDNDVSQTSVVGELSTYARTFSREIGHYTNATYGDVGFSSFYSIDDGLGEIAVNASSRDIILAIGQWVYEQAVLGTFTVDKAACLAAINAEFIGLISDLAVGDMVEYDATTFFPENIYFVNADVAVDPNNIKVWFSDPAFRVQYDKYTFVVVPPIDVVDDLRQPALTVKALLDAISNADQMLRIQTAANGDPTTVIRVSDSVWVNPADPTVELTTSWSVLIYGAAGDSIDLIRTAIIDYILANSAFIFTEWEDWLPHIFKVTEFIITPFWDKYSIPNQTLVTGLHTPTINHSEVLARAIATAPNYDAAHVESMLNTSVSNFRSTAFMAVGAASNADGIYELYVKFPDYFVVPTTSIEFGRMSPDTQAWVMLLAQMLNVADTMTEYSEIPITMSRLIRDNIMYLVAVYNDVQYLVVSHQSHLTLYPEA